MTRNRVCFEEFKNVFVVKFLIRRNWRQREQLVVWKWSIIGWKERILNGSTNSGNIFDSRDSFGTPYTLPSISFLVSPLSCQSRRRKKGVGHCCVEIVRNYDNSWAGLAELMKTRAWGRRKGDETLDKRKDRLIVTNTDPGLPNYKLTSWANFLPFSPIERRFVSFHDLAHIDPLSFLSFSLFPRLIEFKIKSSFNYHQFIVKFSNLTCA